MTFPKSERLGFLSCFPHDGQRNAVSLTSLRHSGQLTNAINLSSMINKILSFHTGQNIEKVIQDTDRDYFMSAEEAKNYGIVDKVVQTLQETKTPVK